MLSLLTAGLLSGCGIRGSLKTPPPLFGGDSNVAPERIPGENFDKREAEDDELFIDDPFIDDPLLDDSDLDNPGTDT